ncbi:hypothetical protein K7X08_022181 [Anisodus acutangulus]|uniref:Pectinesterase n=1 Tax=Anisodus acutangulus TaxID=402998 RepID=A0A9Q1L5G8_9SOLA|nr:hypothetical protein K7X08_022181 [Anisodus acutangulus]
MVKNILDASTGNLNRTNAAKVCIEVLRYSEYRLNLTADAFPRGVIKHARAWMSGAMVYQYDCWSALNADGSSRQDFNGGVPTGMKPNVTVCKAGGGCDYETVQEAVNVAPENDVTWRFVIWIKAGLYEEIVRVPLEKRNLVFLGDGMGKTVLTGSRNVGQLGVSTYDSATVGVVGDGFMASGITIQNTAGPDTHQAVAFRSDSDLVGLQGLQETEITSNCLCKN